MQRTLPPLTDLTQPYWEGCKAGELKLQRCSDCGEHQFYPRNICAHCTSRNLAWITASGVGKIASFTVVRRAISKAYDAPYIVALVDLEEGVRMMSNVVDADPEQVSVGDPVTVDFENWSDEVRLPVFRLANSGDTA
jgi:uncharacterized OB-fold protein